MGLQITYWGVRGSIACPTPRHMRYGGNTSCVQVEVADRHIILDAGTGIRELGANFLKRNIKEAIILLSHTHWDHINGFPFFTPAYVPGHSFLVRAGHLLDLPGGIRAALAGQMAQPMFPVPLETMQSNIEFEDFDGTKPGNSWSLEPGPGAEGKGPVTIRTTPLNHPNGAVGYRIEHDGRAFCYITDTEHRPAEGLDKGILDLISDADLVTYDCTYTDAEWPSKVGWGHSTWQEGVRLCQAAGAKQLAIFHHDPEHDDDMMDTIAAAAAQTWDGAIVAKEGMTITL